AVPGEEIGANEIEGGVRRESPGEPEVQLGPEIVAVALHPAVLTDRGPRRGAGAARGRELAARIGVDGLRREQRVDDPVEAQRGGEGVRAPARDAGATVAVVADVVAGRRPALVEVVDGSGGEEIRPAAGEAVGGRVERLVVATPLGQVVARLVARAVRAARLEQQGPKLITGDQVEEESA